MTQRGRKKSLHSYARGEVRSVFVRPDVPRVLFVNWARVRGGSGAAAGRERRGDAAVTRPSARHSNARLVFAHPHNLIRMRTRNESNALGETRNERYTPGTCPALPWSAQACNHPPLTKITDTNEALMYEPELSATQPITQPSISCKKINYVLYERCTNRRVSQLDVMI